MGMGTGIHMGIPHPYVYPVRKSKLNYGFSSLRMALPARFSPTS